MRMNGLGAAALGLTVLAAPALSGPAPAAFPGSNGRLVFEHEMPAGDHTQSDLYAVSPAGADLVRLTASRDRNEFGPAWSPAGTRLAFWRTPAPSGPGSIWVMNGQGGQQKQLTNGMDARDPVWNPAGTRIAFTRVSGTNFDLWTMRSSDGGGVRPVTSGPRLDFEPAWSPDGSRIAFTRGSERGDVGDLYVLVLKSGVIHRVTHSPAYDHQVNWAPGGRRLVFERDFDHSSSIFVANADGSQLRRLTGGQFFDTGPAFSPDGRRIAFGTDRGTAGLDDLWIMTADGTDRHTVRQLRYAESFPDWQSLPH